MGGSLPGGQIKKSLGLLIFLFFYVLRCFAQEGGGQQERVLQEKVQQENIPARAFKLNQVIRLSGSGFQEALLAPVFMLETKRKNRHEFEINRFGFTFRRRQEEDSRGLHPAYTRRSALGLRYQYTYSFLSEARFSPFLGASLASNLSYHSFRPTRLRTFAYATLRSEQIMELVPGLRWRMSRRFGMEYSLGIPLLHHRYYYQRLNSLALGSGHYGAYSLRAAAFSFYQHRLGLYLNL